MSAIRDEYEQLTDGRHEPKDDRHADDIVLEIEERNAKGQKIDPKDITMLVIAYNRLSSELEARLKRNELAVVMDECTEKMKAGM